MFILIWVRNSLIWRIIGQVNSKVTWKWFRGSLVFRYYWYFNRWVYVYTSRIPLCIQDVFISAKFTFELKRFHWKGQASARLQSGLFFYTASNESTSLRAWDLINRSKYFSLLQSRIALHSHSSARLSDRVHVPFTVPKIKA